MTAAGRVCTGFAYPYVAKYTNTSGTISYNEGMELARGVKVDLQPTVGDDNGFYANNRKVESSAGTMTGGDLTLTVDGLNPDARKFIQGLPASSSFNGVEGQAFGDEANPPYVCVGYITRYISDGEEIFVPTLLKKVRFDIPKEAAETQGESISYQTEELTAKLHRDDSAHHA